ncbi:MAG: protein kinase [Gemmatimonadota bacterium]
MVDLLDRIRTGLAERYRIEHELGRGGMATVYRALDLRHGRHVAIKVLRPELAATLGGERFLREIGIESRLQHPHILPLHDSGEVEGTLFCVMPYVEGESLRGRLDRDTRLPIEEAVRIGREVSDALQYAHRRGVIHRDIKPGNIMLASGHAIVTDFGIAKAVAEAGGERLTQTGLAVGTPAYMSPEQGSGSERVDERSDLYSLGCVLFEMLAGRPPFTGRSAQAVLAQHMVEPVPSVQLARPETPHHVAEAIRRALAKDPEERFATAAELSAALEGRTETAAPAVRATARLRWKRWFVGWHRVALITIALGALGTLAAVIRAGGLDPAKAYAVAEPRLSYAIPSFVAVSGTAEERQLADRVAFEIGHILRGWGPIRVVNRFALAGSASRLGIDVERAVSLDEGLTLARDVLVGSLVLGELSARGDSVHLSVYVYDAASGGEIEAIPETGALDDLWDLVYRTANRIAFLLDAEDRSPFEWQDMSRSPPAIQEYLIGLEALERWRLHEAERAFLAAIASDTAFALPHHYLAVTIAWQDAIRASRLATREDSIRRLTAEAVALAERSEGLPWADGQRVAAFHSFQHGELDEARHLYREILGRDSTDAWAWLHMGSVEFSDRSIVTREEGGPRPRQDLNLAVRAFRRAVQVKPDFHLGYGSLFRTYRSVTSYALAGACRLFVASPEEAAELMQTGADRADRVFCPVWLDTIAWLEPDSLASVDRERVAATALAYRDSAEAQLRRWSLSPGAARPHEELALLYEMRRYDRERATGAAEIAGLADSALRHREIALRLAGDTLPEDRVQLGALHLALEEVARAVALTEDGLSRLAGVSIVLDGAPNAFLAAGRPRRALEAMERVGSSPMMTADGPDGRAVSFGGAERTLDRIQILGSGGVPSPRLGAEFEELWRIWSGPTYSRPELALLAGNPEVVIRIAPALLLDAAALEEWTSRLDTVPVAWQAYRLSERDPRSANAALDLALTALEEEVDGDRSREYYVIGVTAQHLDRHQVAIRTLERLDAWPIALEVLDGAWGLLSLSYLQRARSYEALGDTTSAVRFYERFVEAWSEAEPAQRPLVGEAREALRRLR